MGSKLLDTYGAGAVALSCTAAPFSSAGVVCCRTIRTSLTADLPRVYPPPGVWLVAVQPRGLSRSCGQFGFPRLSEPRSLHKLMW